MKLVQREAESDALRRFLIRHRSDERVTSALSRVEVVRAVQLGGPAAIAKARRQLGRLYQANVEVALLDVAASLAPGTSLRSLDAVHLASAQLFVGDLRAILTYDHRMASAATALGFVVEAPA